MNTSLSSDNVSTTGSNDLLWETIKMDLDQNRAYQKEQVQSLKSKITCASAKKTKIRKVRRSYRSKLKRIAKRKAYRLALQSLKQVLAPKYNRNRKSHPHCTDCTSTMDFKVSFDTQAIGNETLLKPTVTLDETANKDFQENKLVDKSVQTTGTCFEEKFSQTSDIAYIARNYGFESSNPYIPVHFPPIHLCGINLGNVPTCCANNMHSVISSCSVHGQCDKASGLKNLSRQSQTPTSRYSLKEICEELLVQLSNIEKGEALQTKASDNFPLKSNFNAGKTTGPPNDMCHDRSSLNGAPPNLNLDQTLQLDSELAAVASVVTSFVHSESTEAKQSQSTLHVAHCSLPSDESPEIAPLTAVSGQTITPDLLRESDNRYTKKPNEFLDSAKSPPQKEKMKILNFDCIPSRKLNFGGTENHQQDKPQPKHKSDLIENKNEPKESDVVQAADKIHDPPTDVDDLSHVEHNGNDAVTISRENYSVSLSISDQSTREGSKENVEKLADKNLTRCSAGSEKNSVDSKTAAANNDNIVEQQNYTSAESRCVEKFDPNKLPVDSNQNVTEESASSPTVFELHKNFSESGPNCNNENIRCKVLSRIKRDFPNMSREELQNSPAFEEMDTSEMETILLIWRQQEQLHKDQIETDKNKSSPTSPGNIFRKVKMALELPPELRSTRTIQHPPVKKNCVPTSSALDLLDMEPNKKDSSEDDDISESSPHCEISPPKRRRLKLSLNSQSKLVIHKSKDNLVKPETSNSSITSTSKETPSKNTPAPVTPKETPSGLRASSRLKAASSQKEIEVNVDHITTDENDKIKKGSKESKPKPSPHKKPAAKTKGKKAVDIADSSTSAVGAKEVKVKRNKNEIVQENNKKDIVQESKQTEIALCNNDTSINEGSDKSDFSDQIQERVIKLKRKWLQEKSDEEINVVDICPTPETAPSSMSDSQKTNVDSQKTNVDSQKPDVDSQKTDVDSQKTDVDSQKTDVDSQKTDVTDYSQDLFVSQNKQTQARSVPIPELAKAHDLATHVLLNPWRGINARRVTRGFVCPPYETKIVTRALWDLRSNGDMNNVVERILSLGWKGYNLNALRAIVAMFTLSFSRRVPFVIDGLKGEEDDTGSTSSDADVVSKKKSIPVRLVATKQIFKGECIEGLHGLLLKTTVKEKETLRSWNCPKFKDRRDWVLLGPLAYLKRNESNYNTQAVFLKDELIAVKATRLILTGEPLFVSFKNVERKLLKSG